MSLTAVVLLTPAWSVAQSVSPLPAPQPILIQPRAYAAYAAVLGAALLGCLYLYRRKRFILYWMFGWLFLAGSMSARLLDEFAILTGYPASASAGAMFAVWSAGLLLLAPTAVTAHQTAWRWVRLVAVVSFAWLLLAPLVLERPTVAASGYFAASVVLVCVAARYLHLWRGTHSVGAFLIGVGTAGVAASNLGGAALASSISLAPQMFNVLLGLNVVLNTFVALGMHLFVFEDMTEELRRANSRLAAANEEVKRLAITDPLTGCHNRRSFEEIERREIQRHRRQGAPLSVVFADVNGFKALNDRLGHDRGDEILRRIGALLRRHVRETDYVIRWGGDEFVLLLACGELEANSKATELKTALARETAAAGLPEEVDLSIGIAEVSRDAATLAEAVREADARMYRAKAGGPPKSLQVQ